MAAVRSRSFPLLMSRAFGFAVDEGINADMGKLICALTHHHGDKLMDDDFDDDLLPIDFLFKTKEELEGPEFYTCVKRIVTRVVPEYNFKGMIVQDTRGKGGIIDGVILALSFEELKDRLMVHID